MNIWNIIGSIMMAIPFIWFIFLLIRHLYRDMEKKEFIVGSLITIGTFAWIVISCVLMAIQ